MRWTPWALSARFATLPVAGMSRAEAQAALMRLDRCASSSMRSNVD